MAGRTEDGVGADPEKVQHMPPQDYVIDMDADDGLPGRFARPPGALGRVVAVGHAMGIKDNRWQALAGALAGLSAATRNRWVVEFDGMRTRLNLYVLAVGATGTGKEAGRALARLLASTARVGYQERITSDAALHEVLTGTPQVLLSVDEFGRYLSRSRADSGGHQQGLITMLMSLYGLAGSFLAERSYSNANNNKPAVQQPFVACLFSTTHVRLDEGLESADAVDGTLNRMTLVPEGTRAASFKQLGSHNLHSDQLPDDLKLMCRRLHLGPLDQPPAPGDDVDVGLLASGAPELGLVLMDDLLTKRHDAIRKAFQDKADADPKLAPFWTRAAEQVLRLAGIMTVSDKALSGFLPTTLNMDPQVHQWAADFTSASVEWLAQRVGTSLVSTDRERIQQAILKAIGDLSVTAADPGPGVGWVLARRVQDRVKGRGRSRQSVKDEFDTLAASGLIEGCRWPPGSVVGDKVGAGYYRKL